MVPGQRVFVAKSYLGKKPTEQLAPEEKYYNVQTAREINYTFKRDRCKTRATNLPARESERQFMSGWTSCSNKHLYAWETVSASFCIKRLGG